MASVVRAGVIILATHRFIGGTDPTFTGLIFGTSITVIADRSIRRMGTSGAGTHIVRAAVAIIAIDEDPRLTHCILTRIRDGT